MWYAEETKTRGFINGNKEQHLSVKWGWLLKSLRNPEGKKPRNINILTYIFQNTFQMIYFIQKLGMHFMSLYVWCFYVDWKISKFDNDTFSRSNILIFFTLNFNKVTLFYWKKFIPNHYYYKPQSHSGL